MMSRWPWVTGSNDPGQRAVDTQSPPVVRVGLSDRAVESKNGESNGRVGGTGESRNRKVKSVSPKVRSQPVESPGGATTAWRTGRSTLTIASAPSQPGAGRSAEQVGDLVVGHSVRRVDEDHVEGRVGRRPGGEEPAHVAGDDVDPRVVGQHADVGSDRLQRGAVPLDEHGRRGAA